MHDEERLTKGQRKQLRIVANREWKCLNKAAWSDKDPNPRHSQYYKSQLHLGEEEWQKVQQSFRTPLCVTFRLSDRLDSTCVIRNGIESNLLHDFSKIHGRFIEINGNIVSDAVVVQEIWCNAWKICADSAALSQSASLTTLHQMITREVALGHIIRQELVSMIPSCIIDIDQDFRLLDMCAAPGSKTEQMLSRLSSCLRSNNGGLKLYHSSDGVVVANDVDPKRIKVLCQRYRRCGSPNLLVTCSRAEDLRAAVGPSCDFDRIICDVPCSGDGTFRKCPHLWRLFRARSAVELHPIQLQIAKSAVKLLKPAGYIVYSTCSINPIEDEAVVVALLRHFKGSLRLVDVRTTSRLPLLRSREGLTSWRCDEDVFVLGEESDAERLASLSKLPRIAESMRPPSPEEAAEMCLERCMRILPHDQDTGGFFVALMQKVSKADTKSFALDALESSQDTAALAKRRKTGSVQRRDGDRRSGGRDTVGVEDSMEVMKKLGYNPKILQKADKKRAKKSDSAADPPSFMPFLPLSPSQLQAAGRALGFVDGVVRTLETDNESYSSSYRSKGAATKAADISVGGGGGAAAIVGSVINIPAFVETHDNFEVTNKKKRKNDDADLLSTPSISSSAPILVLRHCEQVPDSTDRHLDAMKEIRKREKSSKPESIAGQWRAATDLSLTSRAHADVVVIQDRIADVHMISSGVLQILSHTQQDVVAQAGVRIATVNLSRNTWTHDPDGVKSLLPFLKAHEIARVSMEDFLYLLYQAKRKCSDLTEASTDTATKVVLTLRKNECKSHIFDKHRATVADDLGLASHTQTAAATGDDDTVELGNDDGISLLGFKELHRLALGVAKSARSESLPSQSVTGGSTSSQSHSQSQSQSQSQSVTGGSTSVLSADVEGPGSRCSSFIVMPQSFSQEKFANMDQPERKNGTATADSKGGGSGGTGTATGTCSVGGTATGENSQKRRLSKAEKKVTKKRDMRSSHASSSGGAHCYTDEGSDANVKTADTAAADVKELTTDSTASPTNQLHSLHCDNLAIVLSVKSVARIVGTDGGEGGASGDVDSDFDVIMQMEFLTPVDTCQSMISAINSVYKHFNS